MIFFHGGGGIGLAVIGNSDQNNGMNQRMHLYLTGYRGTGKSTVGRLLADRMGRQCVDLDDLIEANTGQSIRQIFDHGGEELFRRYECDALVEVAQGEAGVIALGGGAILKPENRHAISRTGHCFWLDADAETLLGRLRGEVSTCERRPPLTDLSELSEIQEMLKVRRPIYAEASHWRIDVSDHSPEQIAIEIYDRWCELQGSSE